MFSSVIFLFIIIIYYFHRSFQVHEERTRKNLLHLTSFILLIHIIIIVN